MAIVSVRYSPAGTSFAVLMTGVVLVMWALPNAAILYWARRLFIANAETRPLGKEPVNSPAEIRETNRL